MRFEIVIKPLCRPVLPLIVCGALASAPSLRAADAAELLLFDLA